MNMLLKHYKTIQHNAIRIGCVRVSMKMIHAQSTPKSHMGRKWRNERNRQKSYANLMTTTTKTVVVETATETEHLENENVDWTETKTRTQRERESERVGERENTNRGVERSQKGRKKYIGHKKWLLESRLLFDSLTTEYLIRDVVSTKCWHDTHFYFVIDINPTIKATTKTINAVHWRMEQR